jgi:hypothetical protein
MEAKWRKTGMVKAQIENERKITDQTRLMPGRLAAE